MAIFITGHFRSAALAVDPAAAGLGLAKRGMEAH